MKIITFTVNMLKGILFSALLLSSASADRPRADPLAHRVVGGTPTTIQQYPFIVGMLRDAWGNGAFSQACGGTILTSRHILSAAHCYQGNMNQANRWRIRAGSTWRSSGGTVVNVNRIINHPQYNDNSLNNDITVLTLSNNLVAGSSISQALIPTQGWSNPDNALSYAIGWGTTSSGGSASETLLQGAVRTVNQQTCVQRYATLGWTVTNTMLCAGLLGVGGVDACQGDSGGPFVYNNAVIGVTSWGNGCGLANFPGVYARVSFFTNWIVSTVNSS